MALTNNDIIKKLRVALQLRDDEIVETLKCSGINVARRTVAKYRKVQSIPASFMRKRQSTLAGML